MILTLSHYLRQAQKQLRTISDCAELEAEVLLAFTLGKERSYLYAHPDDLLSEEEVTHFQANLTRRLKREPIAYITGNKDFWGLQLTVNPAVLIPRPETELLIEIVLQKLANKTAKIADLGTGSGAIALALAHERPHWTIYATDADENALAIAKLNAEKAGINNVHFARGHWLKALDQCDFDLIVSNPPYISESEWPKYAEGLRYEPRKALVADEDGLAAIKEICHQAGRHLKSGGYLLIEHGFLQGAAVRELLSATGFKNLTTFPDLAGLERATLGQI